MVIYEDNMSFILTVQHEHALLSEGFAKHWNDGFFLGLDKKEAVLYAIAQHDRSWIDVDVSPIWNDKSNKPYSFIDFPLSIKLHFYRKGIDEIEEKNQYAALLCSIHYTNFFNGMTDDDRINTYVKDEQMRQKRLLKDLNIQEEDQSLHFHYNLLSFSDAISLFVCMQEAGVVDQDVHNWFKKGIFQPFEFFSANRFHVEWKSKKEIFVHPFPFNKDFELTIPLRRVSKDLVKKNGIITAFHGTAIENRTVKITSK